MAGLIKTDERNRDGKSSDYSSMAVPHDARLRKGSLTMAWWAICSAMFWLVVSATLALAFGTVNALIGLVLSVACYGVINGVIARYAIKTGLSVALFSRIIFGNVGAALAALIFFATAIYYSVFEGSVIAVAIHDYFPALTLDNAYLIVVLYSVPLVFGSVQNWLDKLNGVLMPFYLIGLVGAVAVALWNYGYSDAWLKLGPASGPVAHGWWNCFVYFMGVWILMMYTWDYARFGHKDDSDYHARVNFGLPFYLFTFLVNGAIGIFLAATIPTQGALSEVSVVLAIIQLMGIWGLLFVWVSQTRINTANFFLAAVNMQAFFERFGVQGLPRFVWAIIVGAIVYLLMLLNVFSFILQALAYQSIFVVAWVAVALAHIAAVRSGEQIEQHEAFDFSQARSYNGSGLFAWFAGAGVGIAILNFGSADISTFSAPLTFAVAFSFYLLMARRAKADWLLAVPADD